MSEFLESVISYLTVDLCYIWPKILAYKLSGPIKLSRNCVDKLKAASNQMIQSSGSKPRFRRVSRRATSKEPERSARL